MLEASVEKPSPFLSFVLQVDPAVVRRVSSDMRERTTTTAASPCTGRSAAQEPDIRRDSADLADSRPEYTTTKANWVQLTGGTRDPFTLG